MDAATTNHYRTSQELVGPVTFLAPDASRTGAPIVLLSLLHWFKCRTDLAFRIVLFQDGPLAAEFADLAPTITLTDVGVGRWGLVRRIGKLPVLGPSLKTLWHHLITSRALNERPSVIYANSVASARLIRQLAPPEVPLIVHVHELEEAIQSAAGPQGMTTIKSLARKYIAASEAVRQNLISRHGIDPSQIVTFPTFIAIDESIAPQAVMHRRALRRHLGISEDAIVVSACGSIERRKGCDLFVDMARIIRASPGGQTVHFVWVGKALNDHFNQTVACTVQESGLSGVCHFVGEHPRPVELFCGSDVFVLSSREEPMGLAALEAASVGKPIVCFAGAGGMPDFVGSECGKIVSPMTANALAGAVMELISSAELRNALGRQAFEKVRSSHRIDVIAPRVLNVINSVGAT